VPPQDGLGPDDGYGVKDARAATIEPNEQNTIGPTQMQSAWRSLPKNVELMPQHQDLGFQLLSRLEAVAACGRTAGQLQSCGDHVLIRR